MDAVELRCPRFEYTLLARATLDATNATVQIACPACKQQLRKRGLVVARVLHTFAMSTGDCIVTEEVPAT